MSRFVVVVTVLVLSQFANQANSQLTFTPGWRTRILGKDRSTRAGTSSLASANQMQKRQDDLPLVDLTSSSTDALTSPNDHWPVPAWTTSAGSASENSADFEKACRLLHDHLSHLFLSVRQFGSIAINEMPSRIWPSSVILYLCVDSK